MDEIYLIKERREEMLREVEANRLARKLRRGRRRESLAAVFARELKLDVVRFIGIFRGSAKAGERKGRL